MNGTINIFVHLRQPKRPRRKCLPKSKWITIFQFAIFYNVDLEINPGPNMDVTGPVHCNANIYMQPGSTLTFYNDVTAAGDIIQDKKPGDPLVRSGGNIVYKQKHTSGVS